MRCALTYEFKVNGIFIYNLRANLFYCAAPVDFSCSSVLVNLFYRFVEAVNKKISDDKKVGVDWEEYLVGF